MADQGNRMWHGQDGHGTDRAATGDGFVQQVADFIDRRKLLAPGDRVVAAVSGGADSVAMLAALNDLSLLAGRGWRLHVAHLNHCLRPEAARDAEFVAALAAGLGLECTVESADVKRHAGEAGMGIEEAARELRYDFLRRVASRQGASAVAVAHHADDNVETVLYRLARGTHLRGLAGISAARPLDATGIRIVRPLLAVTRGQIEDFCRRRGLVWQSDSTNADIKYRRNFVRHQVLPMLERINSRASEAVGRLSQAAADAEAMLAEWAKTALDAAVAKDGACGAGVGRAMPAAAGDGQDGGQCPPYEALEIDVAALTAQPPLMRAYVMREALERLGVPMQAMSMTRLEELASMLCPGGPAAVVLGGAWQARREGGRVRIMRPAPADAGAAKSAAADAPVVLNCPGETLLSDGRRVQCRVEPLDAVAFAEHCRRHPAGVELLDADQVVGGLLCRPRQAGDAFVPLGSSGRQSVSDFLTNTKMPQARRGRVRCICDETGIVYVAPLRIDHRVRVTDQTRNVLRIEMSE